MSSDNTVSSQEISRDFRAPWSQTFREFVLVCTSKIIEQILLNRNNSWLPRNMFSLIRNKDCFIAQDTRVFIQFHLFTCRPISNRQYRYTFHLYSQSQSNIIMCNYKHGQSLYSHIMWMRLWKVSIGVFCWVPPATNIH